jgi:uncharacterized protein YidB (DUF937 family)
MRRGMALKWRAKSRVWPSLMAGAHARDQPTQGTFSPAELFPPVTTRRNTMSRGFPSMTALLGLLAIAGYQNRDKIAELLRGMGQNTPGGAGQSGLGGLLGQLGGSLGGASAGGILSSGLSELIDRFKQSGNGEAADSWVRTGPNKQIAPSQLEQAIGPEVLDTLSRQTGLSREELLARLSRELPEAVDKYTPEGRLPTEAELARS